MLIGQNPGAEEDKTGRPFVGRSGRYLNEVLQKNGIDRESLFITSVVKHVSPNNRLPKPDEVCACMPYVTCQMGLIKPRIVVLMGALAWQVPQLNDLEYVRTYHPSAALRGFTKIRKKFDEDFVALKKRL
jgi:uracil-DNA glycosylase family 4